MLAKMMSAGALTLLLTAGVQAYTQGSHALGGGPG
jgi:hypothetical protein